MGKTNKGYWEYDPVIYPRKLWVAIGLEHKDISNTFTDNNGEELKQPNKDYDGLTISEVMRRTDNKMGEFVIFDTKKSMTMNVCTHEASHVCDAIEEVIGIEHGGESSAYLLGWIASCINMARLGIGEFVTIKSESNE